MNNLEKKRKLVEKVLLANLMCFPFLAISTVVVVALEAVTYRGFVSSHLFISPDIFFVLLIISGYLMVTGNITYIKTRYFDLLSKLTILFMPALLLVGSIFISLENKNYKGYVYTHGFHFDPSYFYYFFSIALLIIVIDISKLKGVFGKYRQSEISKVFLSVIVFILFFYLVFSNLTNLYSEAKPKLAVAIKNPLADEVWKGRYLFSDFYDYMNFVNKHTDSDARIMRMTQQSKWPAVSNDGYVRGFIYPRWTVVGDEDSLPSLNVTHVFIHRAYEPPRVDNYIEKWPTFPVKAEKIIYMQDNDFTKDPIVIYKDYDPDDHTYDNLWGVIFLKNK